MDIIVNKKRFLLFGKYKLKCSLGKSGIKAFKKEGDLSTPKGTFKLGSLYYRKDRNKKIKCNINKIKIQKNMGWCDDPKSKKYNCPIYFPFKASAERLYIKDNIYDLILVIKYNKNPTYKNKGSAIFIHLTNKQYKPTKGCVSILKKDFLRILPNITKKTKIIIY